MSAIQEISSMTPDELVLDHLEFVRRIVKKYTHTCDEDLIQAGSIGLIKASRSYDPDKGAKFSTYAYLWIRGAILNEFKQRKKHTCVSLDKPLAEDTDMTLGDTIPDNFCLESDAVMQDYIDSVYAELSETNREILTMVINKKTCCEISKIMGVRQSVITKRINDIRKRLKVVCI